VLFAQSPRSVDKVLTKVADVPLPGPAVRFDYQAFDPSSDRLYIAHMNADQLVVFDTSKRQVVANLDGFKHVHGVTVAPEIHRIYASVTGDHQVAAIDTGTLKIVGTVSKGIRRQYIGECGQRDRTCHLPRWPRLCPKAEQGLCLR
jgi:hypothetical protein